MNEVIWEQNSKSKKTMIFRLGEGLGGKREVLPKSHPKTALREAPGTHLWPLVFI